MQVDRRKNRRTAGLAVLIVMAMIGLSYASVPLYDLFCRVTGFAGTPLKAEQAPGSVAERVITVRFDANIDRGLPWRFKPEQGRVDVRVGEEMLVSYLAENLSQEAVSGNATFNVTPEKAGAYFSKIQCFCFDEQVLQPGQKVQMPVSFFLDPELLKDRNMDDVKTITLSYTFFRTPKAGPKLSQAAGGNGKP